MSCTTVCAQGHFEKAEQLYHRVITIEKNAPGHDHPKLAMYFSNLAELLRDQVTAICIYRP